MIDNKLPVILLISFIVIGFFVDVSVAMMAPPYCHPFGDYPPSNVDNCINEEINELSPCLEECSYAYCYPGDEDCNEACAACCLEDDKDGDCNTSGIDNCPNIYNLTQPDGDWDGIGDICDNCPDDDNPNQEDKDADGIGDVCDPETVTSSTVSSSITTTSTSPCPSEQIYGEHSEQTELLRYFRDNVLSETPEGQEIIRLYYEWSPVIVPAMENDAEFKEEVEEMVDGVLEMMGGSDYQQPNPDLHSPNLPPQPSKSTATFVRGSSPYNRT